MCRILQINLGRRRRATDLLYKFAQEQRTDIIIVSEPNLLACSTVDWQKDRKNDVAIKILHNHIKIYDKGSGDGYAWIEMADLVIIGCYISPNVSLETYDNYLYNLQCLYRAQTKNVIFCGDFNARSFSWNDKIENRRGTLLTEFISENELTICNTGNTPTWRRGASSSVLDLTFCSAEIAPRISNWTVADEMESLSDHAYILFQISKTEHDSNYNNNNTNFKIKYNRDKHYNTLKSNYNALKPQTGMDPAAYTELIAATCEKTFDKIRSKTGFKRPVYWWTREIAAIRTQCIAKRRQVTRCTPDDPNRERLISECKCSRKALKAEIRKQKIKAWAELCDDINNDTWGFGYKIATKRFGFNKIDRITEKETERQVKKLFVQHDTICWTNLDTTDGDISPIEKDEMVYAAGRLRSNKAAGPDGITAEWLKAIIEIDPDTCLNVMNTVLRSGEIPPQWKEARLVLIPKPQKEGQSERSYRPLCVLNTIGKLFEHLLLVRLNDEVERNGGLSDLQFGFRKKRSTGDAMAIVKNIVDQINTISYSHRQFCAMATLDVKNAFNSVPWRLIVSNLKEKKISNYIINLIQNYFTNRLLTCSENLNFMMSAGVPQGSVLGPTLWNIYFDPVVGLRTNSNVTISAYADDLAITVFAPSEDQLRTDLEHVIGSINETLNDNGLMLAREKTELVLLAGRRKLKSLIINIAGDRIESKPQTNYLGVMFDRDLRFNLQVTHVVMKAERQIAALCRLMPNVGGPRQQKRRLLASVAESTVLYACHVWADVLRHRKYCNLINKLQRKILIRICRAYRTASTEALQVVAGAIPLDIKIWERSKIATGTDKNDARTASVVAWQDRWSRGTGTGDWTRRLIPDVSVWLTGNQWNVNHQLTQFLTGHGCFNNYLKRIKKLSSDECWFCHETDSPEHTIFKCSQWDGERSILEVRLQQRISPDNIISIMLQDEDRWNLVLNYVTAIMMSKEAEERYKKQHPSNAGGQVSNLQNTEHI